MRNQRLPFRCKLGTLVGQGTKILGRQSCVPDLASLNGHAHVNLLGAARRNGTLQTWASRARQCGSEDSNASRTFVAQILEHGHRSGDAVRTATHSPRSKPQAAGGARLCCHRDLEIHYKSVFLAWKGSNCSCATRPCARYGVCTCGAESNRIGARKIPFFSFQICFEAEGPFLVMNWTRRRREIYIVTRR